MGCFRFVLRTTALGAYLSGVSETSCSSAVCACDITQVAVAASSANNVTCSLDERVLACITSFPLASGSRIAQSRTPQEENTSTTARNDTELALHIFFAIGITHEFIKDARFVFTLSGLLST